MKNHDHLLLIANCLDELSNSDAIKIARLMRGESKMEVFGPISIEIKNSLNNILEEKRTNFTITEATIRIQQKYLLHTDNSGHFDGKYHGKNGHSDIYPMSIYEISKIPDILRKQNNIRIRDNGAKRGLRRFLLTTKIENKILIEIIEVSSNGKFVDIVTAYRPSKK